MKLSAMRKQARSNFRRGPGRGRIKYRWDRDGLVRDVPPEPEEGMYTEVTIVRGRLFTQPQCARQQR